MTVTVGNGQGGIGGAYDPISGSLKVTEQSPSRFDDVSNPVLISADDLAVGTYYYPDTNGVNQLGFGSLSFEGRVRSGSATETLTLTIEGTNGYQWFDIVGPFVDETGTSPLSTPLSSVTNATDNFACSIDFFPYRKWRLKVVVTGTVVDNEVKVASYQRGG